MTAPADKPASLRAILQPYHDHSCHSRQAWFKGQTEPFPCDCSIREAIAAITALIPEKVAPDNINPQPLEKYEKGYNFAIDETHRNFNRQPQGDREE